MIPITTSISTSVKPVDGGRTAGAYALSVCSVLFGNEEIFMCVNSEISDHHRLGVIEFAVCEIEKRVAPVNLFNFKLPLARIVAPG